jgi:hypothetical protein
MNYNSVILVGTLAISVIWWLLHATRHYPGPKVMRLYILDDAAPLNSTEIHEKPHRTDNSPENEAVL